MKKTLLSLILLLSGAAAFAQLPNGSTAPDFTATDINGNTHHLSEYLAAGKTVIIDISATWCGPCWNYHNTHYLDDVCEAYGVDGSNEVVVLFIEGDGATTLNDLHGTGNNTQGDWVTGSAYPIIDSASIANLYQITYFPTVYRICPSGIVTEIGPASASSIRNGINSNCGSTLTGVANHGKVDAAAQRFCTASNNVVKAKIRNFGNSTITSATLELKEDGVLVATKPFSGTLTQFGTSTQSFPAINVNPDATYVAELTAINNATPYNPDLTSKEVPVDLAAMVTQDIEVHIKTDNYPGEISWEIRNSSNAVVASGGPYQGAAGGAAGGPDANTTIIANVSISANDCHSVVLKDSYGDGWTLGSTPHGLDIYNNGELVFAQNGSFATSLTVQAAVTTVQLAVDQHSQNTFSISPNPSTGIFNVRTNEAAAVDVFDLTGKKVFSAASIHDGGVINLTGLQSGIYFAKVKTASAEEVKKLIIQ